MAGIFSKSNGVLERIQDSGTRNIHGKIAACVRFNAMHFVSIDHTHTFDAVCFPVGLKAQDILAVMFGKSNNQFSRSLKRHTQFGSHFIEFLIAFYGTLGPQRPQFIRKPTVKHARVAAGVSCRHIQFLFKNGCF